MRVMVAIMPGVCDFLLIAFFAFCTVDNIQELELLIKYYRMLLGFCLVW